jgi:hypothetical protein
MQEHLLFTDSGRNEMNCDFSGAEGGFDVNGALRLSVARICSGVGCACRRVIGALAVVGSTSLLAGCNCTSEHWTLFETDSITRYLDGTVCGDRYVFGEDDGKFNKHICLDSDGNRVDDSQSYSGNNEFIQRGNNDRTNLVPGNVGR